ncbi:MAG: hypothetical protein II407_08210 [Prevotella sp.]|jgi:hypothetical protein|nr:hypothetical protein [Prevotella sp.]
MKKYIRPGICSQSFVMDEMICLSYYNIMSEDRQLSKEGFFEDDNDANQLPSVSVWDE